MSHIRNKIGVLEMSRKEGLKKTWKTYTFKVSANTYFLQFKNDNLSKPHGQILLARVTKVCTPAASGARFPFEVHFKGKESKGQSSPWVLNAATNEERMNWMEAISPGSSAELKKTSGRVTMGPAPGSPPHSPTHTLPPQFPNSPPPYPTGGYEPHPPSVSPPHQPARGHEPRPTLAGPPHQPARGHEPRPTSAGHSSNHTQVSHQRSLQERETNPYVMDPLMQSWPMRSTQGSRSPQPPQEPQAYLEPISSHHPFVSSSPRHNRSTISHPPRPPPRPVLKTAETVPELFDEDDDVPEGGYIEVRRDPNRVPGRPKPVPRKRKPPSLPAKENLYLTVQSPVESEDPEREAGAADYLTMQHETLNDYTPMHPAGQEDDYTTMNPEGVPPDDYTTMQPSAHEQAGNEYVIDSPPPPPLMPKGIKNGYPSSTDRPSQEEHRVSDAVSKMSENFSPSQLALLIQMLQQVNTGVSVATKPSSPSQTSNLTDSVGLRSNLKKVLQYTPALSDDILITEDDEGYTPRPDWAKASEYAAMAPSQDDDDEEDTLAQLEQEALYIPYSKLSAFKKIGEGQFGTVNSAILDRGGSTVAVAVKTVKKALPEAQKASFMKEMTIMSKMMHPNIVKLYGIVTEDPPDVPSPLIVLEYLQHGDLKTFLSRNKRPVQMLVKYMTDVAMGMHYLSERGLVHRDLAARNVLVGEGELCKVADFGLLRELPKDISVYHQQSTTPCPIRWMPPEAISRRSFSVASDVWSFGVLQWEMFNPGRMPYHQMDNFAVATNLAQGLRLSIPRGCPAVVARIMKACWHSNPDKRPSFLLILTLLTTKVTYD